MNGARIQRADKYDEVHELGISQLLPLAKS